MELKIDEQLKNVLIPLSEEKKKDLEASILQYGCVEPIITWNDVIVDGHNRYEICMKHGISFETKEHPFADMLEARLWVWDTLKNSREASLFEKCEMVMQFREDVQAEAFRRMTTGKKGDPCLPVSKGNRQGATDSILGHLAGVSASTMLMAMKLHDEADEEVLKELRAGRIAIKPAYNKLTGKTKTIRSTSTSSVGAEDALPQEDEKDIMSAQSPIKPAQIGGEVIPGMGSKDGFIMHTGGGLEDVPESADAILFEIETALNSFELSVQDALERYTPGMASEKINDEILSMLKKTTKSTVTFAAKYLKEVLGNE